MRVALLAALFLFCSSEGREIHDVLRSIPSKDREKIEQLFSYFVQRDNLGFVLFGDIKAAAFCSIPILCKTPIIPPSVTNTPLKYQQNLKCSWAVWTCYRRRFKHPNIIICEEYDHFEKNLFLQLFFIDKRKLGKLLNRYRIDFEEVLGEHFSPVEFMASLEKKRKLRPLIKHDEKLLGLILGFGEKSSTAFRNISREQEEDPSFKIAGHRPEGCCITPVSFRGNPNDPEVTALVENYTKEILEIEEIFKSDSFLLTTLEKLCSP